MNVTLVEVNKDLVDKAQASIRNSLARVARKQFKDNESDGKKFVEETASRITGSSDLCGAVKSTDIVIEAIVENIKIKHDLFSSIDKVSLESKPKCRPRPNNDCIFGSERSRQRTQSSRRTLRRCQSRKSRR